MKQLQIWQIPRGDKRDRCGKCLVVFKEYKKQTKFPCSDLKGYRFPKLCGRCYQVWRNRIIL